MARYNELTVTVLQHEPFKVAKLPNPAKFPGGQIYVSDAAGGAVLAYSNGTNWLRCDTSAIVS